MNPNVGFKCLHYSVTESAGTLKAVIIRKSETPLTVGVRTIDDTALNGEDYRGIDKIINLTSHEHIIEVEIIDDD